MALINDRLRDLRKLRGFSQGEFSARLGIAQQQYSLYERSVAPKPELIAKIVSELDTSADYLIGATDTSISFNTLRAQLTEAVKQKDWLMIEEIIKELGRTTHATHWDVD